MLETGKIEYSVAFLKNKKINNGESWNSNLENIEYKEIRGTVSVQMYQNTGNLLVRKLNIVYIETGKKATREKYGGIQER